MIEVIFLLIVTLVSSNWVMWMFSLCLSMLLGLFHLNQSFLFSLNGIFQSGSVPNLLIFLSCLLCFLSLIGTPEEKKSHSYAFCLFCLCLVLVMAFSSSNLVMFYVFFEASLIPTLMLIIGWGYQPERLQAGTYMMMYTVGASLPLLLLILWHCFSMSSMDNFTLNLVSMNCSGLLSLVVYGAFLVKLPMYGVHLWLPKAHVEAPLAGSMILAGILLKLGGFGMMQMNYCFNMSLGGSFSFLLVSISMWGGFLATMMCLRQTDVKALVAYSSVGHMSIVASGIILDTTWGVTSAIITMMAHGFSSSAMFCMAYFSYKKIHSRNIPYMKGMLQVYPILSMLWFVLCCVNMACPPTLNLMGEMAVVPVLWYFNFWMGLIMGLLVFFSASYNMYLYSSLNHGSFSSYFLSGFPMKSYSHCVIFAHLLPLLLLLKSSLFLLYFSYIVKHD